MAVVKFTKEDGQPGQLETDTFVRMRRVLEFEAVHHKANTKINWALESWAKETPQEMATILLAGDGVSKFLGKLTMPDGTPVWFNGKNAEGPIAVTSNMPAGTKSAFRLGSKAQPVTEGPEQVQAALKATGGTVLPIPDMTIFGTPSDKGEEPQLEIWDADVPLS